MERTYLGRGQSYEGVLIRIVYSTRACSNVSHVRCETTEERTWLTVLVEKSCSSVVARLARNEVGFGPLQGSDIAPRVVE